MMGPLARKLQQQKMLDRWAKVRADKARAAELAVNPNAPNLDPLAELEMGPEPVAAASDPVGAALAAEDFPAESLTPAEEVPEIVEVQEVPVGRASREWTPEASPRARTQEYLIRVSGTTAGPQMVSILGPCLCGAAKRQWHTPCIGGRNG